jgi:hypothetical protein
MRILILAGDEAIDESFPTLDVYALGALAYALLTHGDRDPPRHRRAGDWARATSPARSRPNSARSSPGRSAARSSSSGNELSVSEVACVATGAPARAFEVRWGPGTT